MKKLILIAGVLAVSGCNAVDRLTTGPIDRQAEYVFNVTREAGEIAEDVRDIQERIEAGEPGAETVEAGG